MRLQTLKSLLAALGSGLLLAASAAAQAADPGVSDSTITLGMSAPFTGPNGAYGKEMKEGALAYFAQLNAAGGVNGRRLRLLSVDDGNDPQRAAENTRRLVDEERVFVMFANNHHDDGRLAPGSGHGVAHRLQHGVGRLGHLQVAAVDRDHAGPQGCRQFAGGARRCHPVSHRAAGRRRAVTT